MANETWKFVQAIFVQAKSKEAMKQVRLQLYTAVSLWLQPYSGSETRKERAHEGVAPSLTGAPLA